MTRGSGYAIGGAGGAGGTGPTGGRGGDAAYALNWGTGTATGGNGGYGGTGNPGHGGGGGDGGDAMATTLAKASPAMAVPPVPGAAAHSVTRELAASYRCGCGAVRQRDRRLSGSADEMAKQASSTHRE